MIPSFDIALADSVVAVITAAADQLPAGTIVERRLLPIYSTDQLQELRIAVAPRLQSRAAAGGSRSRTTREHVVQIAPHLMAAHDDDGQVCESALAEFVGIVETIADAIEAASRQRADDGNTLFAGASYSALATEPLYDPDQLQTPGVMRSVLTVTFRRLA